MRFLLDTQLPKALARALSSQNFEVEHVLDLQLAQSKDSALWRYAAEQNAVILTKDEDFALWVFSGKSGPAVVWLRIGNCPNQLLLSWLLPLMPAIVERLQAGDRLVEVN